jgi:hypothetical protein
MTITDETIVIEPQPVDIPPPPAEPDDGKAPCSECGERYFPGPGMARHLKATHGLDYGVNAERVPCALCNKSLSPSSIAKHMRVVHNRFQRARRGRPPGSKNTMEITATPKPKPRITRSVLTADEITRAAALSLWPSSIPHDKVGALLEWHRHTAEFLESVTNGG